MGSSYARAEASEQVVFGQHIDGKEPEATAKHVDRSYVEVGDVLAELLRQVEAQFNTQVGKLRAEGLERAGDRAEEKASGTQA